MENSRSEGVGGFTGSMVRLGKGGEGVGGVVSDL